MIPILLRTVAFAAIVLLLVNPRMIRSESQGPPAVMVDASLSMAGAGGTWRQALDTAHALADPASLLRQFGAGVERLDTTTGPTAGVSRIDAALAAGLGSGSRVVLVTDGEITEPPWPTPPPNVDVVLLPRDTVADAALVGVQLPSHALLGDTVTATVRVATWGTGLGERATLSVRVSGLQLVRHDFLLPRAPGQSIQTVDFVLDDLAPGERIVRLSLEAAGDREPLDNERVRILTVSDQPAIVVISDPADWEGRYLTQLVSEVARVPVRGFARISDDLWVEVPALRAVSVDRVREAAGAATVLIVRGITGVTARAERRWDWPAGAGGSIPYATGDWYVAEELPASPVAGALAVTNWSVLPPVNGVHLARAPDEDMGRSWNVLSARRGRRGAERPVLIIRDSAGVRSAVTAASGLWRWALRGGEAREAYRTVLSTGIDWLLDDRAPKARRELTAEPVASRGVPVRFAWSGTTPPDSLEVLFQRGDSSYRRVLRFDPAAQARVRLDTGVYRWQAATGDGGTVAVEPYSPEIPPGNITILGGAGMRQPRGAEVPARGRALWFVVAVTALVVEWAWRQRAGLA